MAPIIYNINNAEFRQKMVAFDYDWTVVHPKDGKTFPSQIDDWVWYSPNVPSIIKNYYNEGFMIVIFTNQSKPWKCEQIKLVFQSLDIPVFIVIANVKSEYKPNIILFDSLFKDYVIDKSKSFFVGDALGRKTDFSDSDKIFAENIGVPYYPPEKIFVTNEAITFDISQINLSDNPEIIIMMGYPGSGKTTVANEICSRNNYIHIKGDEYKSNMNKMIKASLEYINDKKSIVFDATNSSIKKRNLYVQLAKKHNYNVQCIHLSSPLDISYKRNLVRQDKKIVPKIAYSVYKKHYQAPNDEEGYTLQTL